MKRALAVAAAAVVGAIAIAGCGGNHKTETFRVNITSTSGVSGFSIGTITVTQGDKIDLRVDNTTEKAHGFSIDAFNIHRVVEPNTAQTVSFTPKKTGEFKVYCQLHPAHVPANIIVIG
ncbi:MAG: cupredoxin domain-containing protein [Acidimicrobiia bacterium]|nr:cupredoxin domain-containing protein [Acidimicrobiia bacterium]MBV9040198.1 cupredoxin domain-containing protein [Acidimicrobiia bacterium]